MEVISDAARMGALTREARCASRTIGLVPTMGYLHEGHLQLARAARAENDLVVLSIYVNPSQFGPREDFDLYPRDFARDQKLAAAEHVDALFVPSDEVMYPGGLAAQQCWIDPGPVGDILEGASRPGHFRGVTTVVTKLFNIVEPDRAYFGQKDGQQAFLIRQMVHDLAFPVEIRVVGTVREEDGLALSSRNVYLSAEHRRQASALPKALEAARKAVLSGDESKAQTIAEEARTAIESAAPDARVDYVAIVNAETCEPVAGNIDGPVMIAAAVNFGSTRLIDNVIA